MSVLEKHRAIAHACEMAQKDYAELERVTDDLAALVRQLVRSLREAAPQHDLPDKALDYLKRKGLQGTPLRHNSIDDGEANTTALAAAGSELCQQIQQLYETGKPVKDWAKNKITNWRKGKDLIKVIENAEAK